MYRVGWKLLSAIHTNFAQNRFRVSLYTQATGCTLRFSFLSQKKKTKYPFVNCLHSKQGPLSSQNRLRIILYENKLESSFTNFSMMNFQNVISSSVWKWWNHRHDSFVLTNIYGRYVYSSLEFLSRLSKIGRH